MSPDRRTFIRLTSRSLGFAGLAGSSGFLAACGGGDLVTNPGDAGEERGPAPQTSMLLPVRQYLPLQGGIELPFESPEAEGESFSWEVVTPGGATARGDGRAFSFEFTSTGIHQVRFTAASTGWPDVTASRQVEILPAIAEQSRTKVAWWVRQAGGQTFELRIADDWRNLNDFRSFGPNWGDAGQFFHGAGQASWNPDQTRLAVSVQDGARRRIAWVDAESGEVELLTDGVRSALDPSVSPSGDFIAYSDTSESTRLAPQLWVMRADGSDKIRIGGRGDEQFFASANSTAWLPDESGILIATRYNPSGGSLDENTPGMVRRVAVVRDYLGGEPTLAPLHIDSKVENFIRSILATGESLSDEEFRTGGDHSMAVHPNGEEVIFPISFTVRGFRREVMVAERIGGGLRLVSESDGACTVSPDGNEVWLHDTTFTSETDVLTRSFQSGGPVSTLAAGVTAATMIR